MTRREDEIGAQLSTQGLAAVTALASRFRLADALADRDCAHKGHHYHEPDGSVYVKAKGSAKRAACMIALTCCFCGHVEHAQNRSVPSAARIRRTPTGCAR